MLPPSEQLTQQLHADRVRLFGWSIRHFPSLLLGPLALPILFPSAVAFSLVYTALRTSEFTLPVSRRRWCRCRCSHHTRRRRRRRRQRRRRLRTSTSFVRRSSVVCRLPFAVCRLPLQYLLRWRSFTSNHGAATRSPFILYQFRTH